MREALIVVLVSCKGGVRGGGRGQFIRLLAAEKCGSGCSDCIIFSKYVDHNLKMSLKGDKKRVKRRCKAETFCSVYKFMRTEFLCHKCRGGFLSNFTA